MDMLTQAIRTKLPFVHVTTDDLIHISDVLSHIAGEEVRPVDIEKVTTNEGISWPEGGIFYTNFEQPSPKLYLTCKNDGKCLIFVNTKTSVMHFNGGVMFPPKDLMRAYLLGLMDDDEEAVDTVLPAYGGLTLKDMYEVTRLTVNRAGSVTTREVNTTRQGYITKLRGITQIDTKYPYYDCPKSLHDWMNENLPFFQKQVAPELTPRGLLFDGPPGTGKTMAAKHLAQTLGVPLYHLDIGGMKGKYVGDSEGNLHAALSQVDQIEPCVVLFDEVEKVFGETHDSGVTSSLLGTILWWLQEHKTKVFTVMTTNHKDKIPPELYREGRIDQTMMFLGIESCTQAIKFAGQVFVALAKDIWDEVPEPDFTDLDKRLKALYSDGNPVPQVRITKEVHSVIKKMFSQQAQEDK